MLLQSTLASPLGDFIHLHGSSSEHRTAFTHFAEAMDPHLDRSAAAAVRARCREGSLATQTSGLAPGFVQANLVCVPKAHAFDFLNFALRNPKACPLLGVTTPGDPCPRNAAPGADLRTDLPKYKIWVDGEPAREVSDASEWWTEDMVGFLLGCSFSWEDKLADAGLTPRHMESPSGYSSATVPMFRTNIRNLASGPFGGDLVVSMRPYPASKLAQVSAITGAYPGAHGAPIHWGDPSLLGIGGSKPNGPEDWAAALAKPDWGDRVEIREGEIPVFWACGVTPQTAVAEAKIPLAITHAPGHMFICDLKDDELCVPVKPEEPP